MSAFCALLLAQADRSYLGEGEAFISHGRSLLLIQGWYV
jgi:hypothetical protein